MEESRVLEVMPSRVGPLGVRSALSCANGRKSVHGAVYLILTSMFDAGQI